MKKLLFAFFALFLCSVLNAQTWNQDIAAIVYDHCGKCHHEGGVAPMSLMTYADAWDAADDMSDAITSNLMPPWPANHNYTNFLDENVLSDSEIQAIVDWANNDAPEGTGSAPQAPSYQDGFLIANPDEVVSIPSYGITQNDDEYRTFVMPSTSASDRNIGSIEFDPGNDDIVHHVLAFYDPSNVSQQYDDAAPGVGFPSNGGSFPSDEAVLIGVWVPGMGPIVFPENLAIPLPGGSDFVFEVHYAPGSIGQQADVQLRLEYKDDAVIRPVYHDPLLFHGWPSLQVPLFIPANTVQSFHETSVQAPIALSLISVFPHMHLLGQTFKVYGLTPSQDTVRIVDVDNYDFHWQFNYIFPTLKKLPIGSILHGDASYDNTEDNESNPNTPPEDVSLGENTTDEMMVCFFMYTVYLPGDEDISMVNIAETKNEATQSLLFAYPNPARNYVLIDIPNNVKKISSVLTTDITGKTIQLDFDFADGRMKLNTSSLSDGVYQLIIQSGKNVFQSRFIKAGN